MKTKVHILFDFRGVMLWDPESHEAIANEDAPVTEPTRLLMNTLGDLYDFAAERGYPTAHEKAVFDKIYEISLPIIRQDLENTYTITSVDYPYIFTVDAREE